MSYTLNPDYRSWTRTTKIPVFAKVLIQAFETKCMTKLLNIFYLEHKTNNWVWSEFYFFVHWSTGTSSGNCQEMETCIVWACLTPLQPPQNHPSGYFGGCATPWAAEEMLDGHHQRVDISAHARTAHKGLLQKRLEEDLCWIIPHVPPMTLSVKGLNWTELIVSLTDCLISCLLISQTDPLIQVLTET